MEWKSHTTVSYTHLDVYKRQAGAGDPSSAVRRSPAPYLFGNCCDCSVCRWRVYRQRKNGEDVYKRQAADQAAELNETGQVGLLRLAEVWSAIRAKMCIRDRLKAVKLRLYEKYTSGSITKAEYQIGRAHV